MLLFAQVLLSVLKRITPQDAASTPDILMAVKQLACNDEICKTYADGGAVATILSIVKAANGNTAVAEAGCGALRQLANSDSIKKLLAGCGGLELISSICSTHSGAEDLVESALGLLVRESACFLLSVTYCYKAKSAYWNIVVGQVLFARTLLC